MPYQSTLIRSSTTIEWFKKIKDKSKCKFIQFDTISKILLQKVLEFSHYKNTDRNTDIDIIINAKRLLLFDDNSYCVKRNRDKLFDVAIEGYDGEEISDHVGRCVPETLKKKKNTRSLHRFIQGRWPRSSI